MYGKKPGVDGCEGGQIFLVPGSAEKHRKHGKPLPTAPFGFYSETIKSLKCAGGNGV